MKITNKDIYTQLQKIQSEQHKGFDAMTQRQDVTNGKVKLAMWVGTTALTLATGTVVILASGNI